MSRGRAATGAGGLGIIGILLALFFGGGGGGGGLVQSLSRQDPDRRNQLSVSLELQADCFAGIWANSMFQRGDVLETGDIEEALSAAAAVGDDRIQSSVTGRINPETWTHGSSEQRVEWFSTGYTTGDANRCDTFS
ncbi:MAG TPA: hypothetical protein ENH15_05005 [Actinobacteria bacterium]|nr:hypothetical protein [Actinomycetota bacterium]